MPRRIASAALLLLIAPAALATPVRHAGEWQTIIDNGNPLVSCAATDKSFDKDSVLAAMGKMQGLTCQFNNWDASGDTITYALQCSFMGTQITTSGAVTQTGSDEFTTKSHTSAFSMTMADGKTMAMPASDMTIVSRRLGACKPGDRQVP